jgi:protein-S-isoprenylcysteine O-methyltransferase Ste14
MTPYLLAYIALIALYRITETVIMTKTGSIRRAPTGDWTAWLIIAPYWAVIVGPALEHLYWETTPGIAFMVGGGLALLAATYVRARAHLDLGRAFSMFLDEDPERRLVRTGLYATIRHPLYLANILLFVGCPLFLEARLTWFATAIGIVGVLVRIRLEERFLNEQMPEYTEYQQQTWKLIPHLY